jgi:TIR domain
MTPSERIKYIIEISKVLGKEDWSVIDLTLKQFQLPWTDQWDGSQTDYVIKMIDDSTDQKILDLSKHLGIAGELESIQLPSFWRANQPRIFISHLSEIKDKAISIKAELEKYSISAFVAHEDIEPTTDWQTEIEIALSTMDVLVALLSPGFNESKWTDQEVGVAIGRAIPIVSIRLGLDPYGFIGKYQGLPGLNKPDTKIAKELTEIFLAKPNITTKITAGIVQKFSNSESFEDAKKNMTFLEMCEHLTSDMTKQLQKAAMENSQIKNSFGVPERLERLIDKISEK